MRLSFRLKLFLAISMVSATGIAVAAAMIGRALADESSARIERDLVSQTHLLAEVMAHGLRDLPPAALDEEADRLGEFVEARVTLIALDGTVVGDSAEDGASLAALENHGMRPEIIAARERGVGTVRRFSTTVNADLLYVAVPVQHPLVAVVRLALPLTEIQSQVRVVRRATAAALALALVVALAVAWVVSARLSWRLRALAARARDYARGRLSLAPQDDGSDDIGQLGRVLDESARAVVSRMAELDLARGRMEGILAGMTEGVIVVDGDGRMQLVNGAAQKMLDIAGAAGQPYLHAVRHPEVVAQFDAAMAGRAAADTEIQLAGGRTAAARAVALTGEGAVLVLHDITRLREADQIRRDFVANVSHELRTPLTAIRGYAEALRDVSLPAAERDRFLGIIERHTQRMDRLVRDLLRLARLEAKREVAHPEPLAIADVFETVITDLRPRLAARRQRVAITIAPGAERVVSDAGKLEEILKNFVDNAITYAPEGSQIGLEAALRDGHYEVAVVDEGPGIPPADLARVFERFYRADKARSRESGGTGLGLSIVKHLVERLNGRVTASNRPEGGARFAVILPTD